MLYHRFHGSLPVPCTELLYHMAQYCEYFIYLEHALFWYLVIISNTVVFCRKQKALWVILLLTGNYTNSEIKYE